MQKRRPPLKALPLLKDANLRKLCWIVALGFYGIAAPSLWLGNKLEELSMRKMKK